MIIDDLDRLGAVTAPHETNAPLIVYSDAVLAPATAFQGFEPVARRRPQINEPGCCVEHVELAPRHGLDGLERGHAFPPVKRFGALVIERPDHRACVTMRFSATGPRHPTAERRRLRGR